MKSKKGFTLIELLAVIVILAIIALIATPIVLNLIEKARTGAAKASAMSYIRAVETYLVTSEIDVTLEKLNANTEYNVSKINVLVELKGTKPTSGTVTISDKSTVASAEIVVNGYTVKYDGKDYEIKGKTVEEKNNIQTNSNVILVNDVNNNSQADIGDEIKIGEEHFYVIKNDGTTVNALAKYNLNVGTNKVSGAEGIQNENAKGYYSGGSVPYPGSVAFSNTNGWPHSNNDTINIKSYDGPVKEILYGVNGYENYLKQTESAVTVRLITKEELEVLINNGSTLVPGSIKNNVDAKGYSWLYSTSYWIESASSYSSSGVWTVRSHGDFGDGDFTVVNYYGVRPVITISSSLISK